MRELVIRGERPFGIAFFLCGNSERIRQTLMSRRTDDRLMTFLSVNFGAFPEFAKGAGTTTKQTIPRLVQALASMPVRPGVKHSEAWSLRACLRLDSMRTGAVRIPDWTYRGPAMNRQYLDIRYVIYAILAMIFNQSRFCHCFRHVLKISR